MSPNERLLWTSAVSAVVFIAIQAYFTTQHVTKSKPLSNGTPPPNTSGSAWTNIGTDDNYQMTPQQAVYNGPGRQAQRASSRGQIFAAKFHPGGNHNSSVNYEQSNAIQTSTKNPFANGTSNTYAWAVNRAGQDPTNQVTALVLGPGVAPNDD